MKSKITLKELATLHDYRPNPAAVNLKKNKTNTIAVIIPNIINSFFATVLSGIEAEEQKEGLQLITYISNESLDREQKICELLISGYVNGILIAVSEETQRKEEHDHIYNLIPH